MPQLVSVITTAYNAEDYVKDAVSSILNQTYSNLEYIIVDDGSTDGTIDRVRSFRDNRLRLVEAGRVGRGRALNIGWKEARGQLIAVQDADDLSLPDRIRMEVDLMERHPHVSVLGSLQDITRDVRAASSSRYEDAGIVRDVTNRLAYFNPISHTSLMVRRETLEAVRGYQESRTAVFDWDLYVRLLASGYRIFRYDRPLVIKRIHDAQYFERRQRLTYARTAAEVQCRALRHLGLGRWIPILLPVCFIYRLLPRRLRLCARNIFEPDSAGSRDLRQA